MLLILERGRRVQTLNEIYDDHVGVTGVTSRPMPTTGIQYVEYEQGG